MSEVSIARVGLSLPCPVPVVPGTPDTMRDGEPIPMEERTEQCCVDAYWMLGAQLICNTHLEEACDLLGIDFAGIVEEGTDGRGLTEREQQPWHERHRYEQPTPEPADA